LPGPAGLVPAGVLILCWGLPMLANWVEGTSTTGGTGALTVSSVSGSPTFTSVWGSSGTRFVHYSIVEFTDTTFATVAKAENGVGSVALSTNALTRTRVFESWDGSAHGTSAVSFGTSSGLVRVRISATAQTWPNLPQFYLAASPSEDLGMPSAAMTVTANAAVTAGREYYSPFLWLGGVITQAGLSVSTAVSSTSAKAGIYEVGSDGKPGQKLLDLTSGGAITTATTGAKVVSVSATLLPPGWYYSGLLFEGAPTMRSYSSTLISPAGTLNGVPVTHVYATGDYSTGLPAPASTSLTAASSACPLLYLKPRNT
jgi:hypothetical protein